MPRIKKQLESALTRAQVEKLVGQIADLMNEERQINAETDARIIEIKQSVEKRLNTVQERLKEKLAVAQLWAETNPQEFGNRKSIDLQHGRIGFRTGTPKLKTAPRLTWAKVLERIKNSVDYAASYIRTKEDVNKDKILDDREKLGKDGLNLIGVRVVQEESFFVDPYLTSNADKLEAKGAA